MKERPILFSSPMIRAILEGRKSQTRRIVKPQPVFGEPMSSSSVNEAWQAGFVDVKCPYGRDGDRLWVRETWAMNDVKYGWGPIPKQRPRGFGEVVYRADGDWKDQFAELDGDIPPWKPSIFMPRWASRIMLEVTGIRVERVQDISAEDCIAEGIDYSKHRCGCETCAMTSQICPASSSSLVMEYAALWNSINGNWDANPWVWVVEFRRIEKEAEHG